MKSKNIPVDIKLKSIKEAQNEINEIMKTLENEETNLEQSIDKYNRMTQLNLHIQDKFRQKLKEINNSNFTNSTGWPDPDHLMTARDIMQLSVRTIEDFPELYKLYSEKEFTYNNIRQVNRNPLLFNSKHTDGLKTGHTSLGGYGLSASAIKNNRRIILVINGLIISSNGSIIIETIYSIHSSHISFFSNHK